MFPYNMSDYKKYKAINPSKSNKSGQMAQGTVRIDTARKILKKGWVNGLVRDYRMTDDYKRDNANDFYKTSQIDASDMLEKIESPEPRRIWVRQMADGSQRIIFYWSFQSYTAELDTSQVRFDFGDVI
jgi:hypothetical protein